MIQRSTGSVDRRKTNEFIIIMESNAKDKSFWEDIKNCFLRNKKGDLEKIFEKE